jgi:hypothetical protein
MPLRTGSLPLNRRPPVLPVWWPLTGVPTQPGALFLTPSMRPSL